MIQYRVEQIFLLEFFFFKVGCLITSLFFTISKRWTQRYFKVSPICLTIENYYSLSNFNIWITHHKHVVCMQWWVAHYSQPVWTGWSQRPFISSILSLLLNDSLQPLFLYLNVALFPPTIAITLETALLNSFNISFLYSGEHTTLVKVLILTLFFCPSS